MSRIFTTIILLGGTRLLCADEAAFKDFVRPFVVKYCIECHDADSNKGKRDFEQTKTEAEVSANFIAFERASHKVKNMEMPPEKQKEKPTKEEREKFVKWWDEYHKKSDCDQLAFDSNTSFYQGYVYSRRLNRTEYRRSVLDLTGVNFDAEHFFPKDAAGGEGFDNQGAALFLSPIHMEKYLDAAEDILNRAVWTPERAKIPETPAKDSPSHQLLFQHLPKDGPGARDAARSNIQSFARRAFRRTPSNEQLPKLMKLYDLAVARGDSFEASVKLALTSILISPRFLYLPEAEQDITGPYRLHDFELASRLSYFLWSSIPDEELLSLAEEGQLSKDDVLIAQVMRMLKDPKAIGFAEDFAAQWLGIRDLGENVKPDPNRFPEFDVELKESMMRETVFLAKEIFTEDKSLLTFLQTDHTWLNERLARHYGLEGVEGEKFQRVVLKDGRRGGLLGMGSILTATSYPLRTSPVLRGRWVLETVFGTHINPPPPGAGDLPADDGHKDGLTFREQLEVHRKNPECASCHNQMDPIGLGLESFDAIGRWRETQYGKPIDASGQFPNGDKFDGPEALRKILMNRKDQFLWQIIRKTFSYALGRGLNRNDQCYIGRTMEDLKKNGYRSSFLIHNVVMSLPFLHRQNR
ncbi:MAG: DUF1592 domain-containing protein [Planctomycetota bacterium]|nr:DUF1592 domain-containing protein [Planctomycetota bacterium]